MNAEPLIDFALSLGLVELHGGIVGAVSQEGKGSTFFFELPLFETPLPSELALEEVYPPPTNIAESIALVSRTMTDTDQNRPEGDLEDGCLQQKKIESPTSAALHRRLFGISSSSSSKYSYSFSSLISSSFSSKIPHPIRIEPSSDVSGEMLDKTPSPFAPNGMQISLGSASRRRRLSLLDQFHNSIFAASPTTTAAAAADYKVDEDGEEEEEVERPDDRVECIGADNNETRKTLRFMIVDDAATTRKLMRRILTSAGHHVDEAVDGYVMLYHVSSFGKDLNN